MIWDTTVVNTTKYKSRAKNCAMWRAQLEYWRVYLQKQMTRFYTYIYICFKLYFFIMLSNFIVLVRLFWFSKNTANCSLIEINRNAQWKKIFVKIVKNGALFLQMNSKFVKCLEYFKISLPLFTIRLKNNRLGKVRSVHLLKEDILRLLKHVTKMQVQIYRTTT